MRAAAITLAAFSTVALAQDAELEFPKLFGECHPIFAATSEFLTVHENPDLRSRSKSIPYSEGWEIPYDTGHTKVIRIGRATAKVDVPLDYCEITPAILTKVSAGQTVEYLFYEGEGFGRIRIGDGQCTVPIHDELGFFDVDDLPDIQPWIRVTYADGTSPGWMSLSSTQLRGAGIRC